MKAFVLALALLAPLAIAPALVWACPVECADGEAYSDEEELCLPIDGKTS